MVLALLLGAAYAIWFTVGFQLSPKKVRASVKVNYKIGKEMIGEMYMKEIEKRWK